MKKSIALAIAILALGAAPGMFFHKRLTDAREEHRKLMVEAAGIGLSTESPAENRHTRRKRVDSDKQAVAAARDIVNFARDMEALRKSGANQESMQERGIELMGRIVALDATQLKKVFAALNDDRSISDDTRRNLIGFAILNLTDNHPEMAVNLFTETSSILDKSTIGDQVITSALSRWAEIAPEAALAWIRANSEKYPTIASDEAKCSVIGGAALNDPRLAFRLMDDLKLEDKSAAVQAILTAGQGGPEQRDAVLAALRGHLAAMTNEQERDELRGQAFETFARNLDKDGFDAATAWVAKSGFTPEEKDKFAGGLSYFITKENTGKWIDWISNNVSADNAGGPVAELVGEWTQQDYQSAGRWLTSSPEGPTKTAAVKAYAEAVAGYEPAVAVQWAMTLPPGPERDATLRSIHENWPATDPAGAAAFAKEHGLE